MFCREGGGGIIDTRSGIAEAPLSGGQKTSTKVRAWTKRGQQSPKDTRTPLTWRFRRKKSFWMTEDAVEGTIQLMHEFIIQFNPKYKWRWRSQSSRLIVIIHQSWQESTDGEKARWLSLIQAPVWKIYSSGKRVGGPSGMLKKKKPRRKSEWEVCQENDVRKLKVWKSFNELFQDAGGGETPRWADGAAIISSAPHLENISAEQQRCGACVPL